MVKSKNTKSKNILKMCDLLLRSLKPPSPWKNTEAMTLMSKEAQGVYFRFDRSDFRKKNRWNWSQANKLQSAVGM